MLAPASGAQAARDLVAVVSRQPDVEQHRVRPEARAAAPARPSPSLAVRDVVAVSSRGSARLSAASPLSSTTSMRQAALPARRAAVRLRRGSRRGRQRQAQREVAALPRAGACALDAAAMQLRPGPAPASGRCPGRPGRRSGRRRAARTGRNRGSMAARCRRRCRARMRRRLELARAARCAARRGVYLAALVSRLANTCARRVASASSQIGAGQLHLAAYDRRLAPISGAAGLHCSADHRPAVSRSRRNSRRPSVMRDTSIRSSTRCVICLTWRPSTSRARPSCGSSSCARSALRARCASGPADCAAHAPAWPEIRPCAGRLAAALVGRARRSLRASCRCCSYFRRRWRQTRRSRRTRAVVPAPHGIEQHRYFFALALAHIEQDLRYAALHLHQRAASGSGGTRAADGQQVRQGFFSQAIRLA